MQSLVVANHRRIIPPLPAGEGRGEGESFRRERSVGSWRGRPNSSEFAHNHFLNLRTVPVMVHPHTLHSSHPMAQFLLVDGPSAQNQAPGCPELSMKFRLTKIGLSAFLACFAWSHSAFSNEIDKAAATGNLQKVTALLKANPDLVFDKNVGGYSPLHVAALNGQMNVVKLLLASNADVNAKGSTGDTPLHFAVAYHHLDVAKVLLMNKADINAKNNRGFTALREAMDWGCSIELLELLISNNADVNTRDNIGFTPLCEAPGTNLAALLLANGADINARSGGGTPLHWAAHNGQKDLVALLIASNADVNARDKDGRTPLHIAVMRGKKPVVESLLANNADVNATDNDGNTPLQFGFNEQEIAAILRQRGGHGKKITTRPLVGWYFDGDSDSQHDPAIVADYQAYARKVFPKDRDFFFAEVAFYENGAGKHAVWFELEPGLRYYVEYYLIYGTNNIRTKAIKWKSRHEFGI